MPRNSQGCAHPASLYFAKKSCQTQGKNSIHSARRATWRVCIAGGWRFPGRRFFILHSSQLMRKIYKYLSLATLIVCLPASKLFAQGSASYSSLSVSENTSLYSLLVSGGSAFGAGMGVGPGSSLLINEFGATFWTTGPDSYTNPTGNNMDVIGTNDDYPMGFVFKMVPDDYGNPIPALLSNQLGYGPLPMDLNTDNSNGADPGPVLVGTFDWDGQSMFEVAGMASFSGPVELQPQGDISMGAFTSMPSQGGNNNNAMGATGARTFGGGTVSGSSGATLSGTGGY